MTTQEFSGALQVNKDAFDTRLEVKVENFTGEIAELRGRIVKHNIHGIDLDDSDIEDIQDDINDIDSDVELEILCPKPIKQEAPDDSNTDTTSNEAVANTIQPEQQPPLKSLPELIRVHAPIVNDTNNLCGKISFESRADGDRHDSNFDVQTNEIDLESPTQISGTQEKVPSKSLPELICVRTPIVGECDKLSGYIPFELTAGGDRYYPDFDVKMKKGIVELLKT